MCGYSCHKIPINEFKNIVSTCSSLCVNDFMFFVVIWTRNSWKINWLFIRVKTKKLIWHLISFHNNDFHLITTQLIKTNIRKFMVNSIFYFSKRASGTKAQYSALFSHGPSAAAIQRNRLAISKISITRVSIEIFDSADEFQLVGLVLSCFQMHVFDFSCLDD